MTRITIPSSLTVEEEEDWNPDPLVENKTTVIVKFGEFEVIRYEIMSTNTGGLLYVVDPETQKRTYYDSVEEFFAAKLKKLFELIG
jgi:hypothetical protein